MAQPTTLPSAQAQQDAAVSVFAQYEPPLYEAYLDMMVEWLAAVKTAMFAGGIARLALVPDPMTVFSQTPKWNGIVSKYTEQVARDVIATPYRDLFANGTLFDTRPFVRNWIADADNRLQQVPNEVYGLVAHIIDGATTNGASIPDVQDQIEQLFTDTGMQRWKNRARTVARTEVVGAYNGGLHDAFQMLVDADPDTAYVKRWLATEDQRTRPDHREADGQTVPWGQPFIVGGFAMQHPHDPDAPAKEVVNCRCVELLEIKNEPTKMSNRQYKDGFALAASGRTLLQEACTDGKFCMQTHKPGLCKGQKRGEAEPGYQPAEKQTPAQVAQVAVTGLNQAIAQAQAAVAANPTNPKLAQMARKAIAGYQRALKPHQQTLKDAARQDAQAVKVGKQDTTQQDTINRQAQAHQQVLQRQAERQKKALEKKADAITRNRAEQAKIAKMGKRERASYLRAKSAKAKAQRIANENQTLKQAAAARAKK